MVYNRREFRNKTDRQVHDACNVDQAIEKLSDPFPRKKRLFLQAAHKKVYTTGKPYSTPYGLINPIKLDISNLSR